MSQQLTIRTQGLYRNTNELSETPEGSLLTADNIVIDKDSIIEPRRGLDSLAYKFRDASDRAINLFFYKDALLAHNSTDLMSRYDSTGVAVTGDFTSSTNIITSIAPNTDDLSVGQTVVGTYVFELTAVADVAGSLAGKYFLFNAAQNSTRYYGWFQVSGSGINPNVPNRTGVQINISTNDTANTVASAINTQVNALTDFNSSVLGAIVTVTNANVGDSDIARNAPGVDSPGFTFNNIGTGVPEGTVIDSIDSASQVTVSQNFTETRTGGNIAFAGWRNYNGTYTAPGAAYTRIRASTSNQNFYFVSNTGVKKLDSLDGTIINSGGIKAIDGAGTTTGSSGFLANNFKVAYRIVWGYKDTNNNLILGVPSERIVVNNTSGGTRDVELTIYIPDGITVDYFYQIYRSEQADVNGEGPSDELRLVYEDNPTSAELTDEEIVLTENTPEDLRDGALIYTAPSQETILQANEIPPYAQDIDVFQNCMFYANTRTRQQLPLTLLAVGAPTGLNYIVQDATYVNATTFTVVSASGIAVGMLITGPGANIPSGLSVSNVNGTTITVTGGTLTAWGGTISVQFRDGITINGVQYISNNLTEYDNTVTFTAASPGKVNWTAHGLTANSTIVFSTTGTLPTGLVAGTTYYVNNPGANDFEIAATQEGTSINLIDTGTGVHTAIANQRRFQVYTGGSPAQNVDTTARQIIRVVNTTSLNTTVYGYYLSGPEDLPGQMLIEARTVSVAQFFTTATSHGSAFNPVLPTSGTSVASINDEFKNGLYFSKPLQPEAVPSGNFLRIGDADEEILRIKRLRDALFIFKKDGIFRVIGDDPTTFRADLLDNTATIVAPESVVTLNNQIFMLADQGVVVVSDTGAEVISRQIENDFLELYSLDFEKVTNLSFGVAYESDRKYMLGIISSDLDTYPTQLYVYNNFTRAWTKWTISKQAGIVDLETDRLYFADAVSNKVNVERKARDYSDYIDDEFNVELLAQSDKVLTLSSVSNIVSGDLLFQGNTFTTKILSVDGSTSQVTIQDEIDFVINEDVTILKAIDVEFEYIPEDARNPGITKQFREISLFFKEGFFDTLTLSFSSDLSGDYEEVELSGYLIGFWGLFPWGSLPWGGATRAINTRTYVPANKQRCSQLSVRVNHREGYSYFLLNGLSLIFNQMSERLRR